MNIISNFKCGADSSLLEESIEVHFLFDYD